MRFASGEWVRLGLLIYVLFVDLCALFVVCAMNIYEYDNANILNLNFE
jgi:hypothetical protein